MREFTVKKLSYDVVANTIAGLVLIILIFLGNMLISVLLNIIPISDFYYKTAASNNPFILTDYQFSLTAILLFCILQVSKAWFQESIETIKSKARKKNVTPEFEVKELNLVAINAEREKLQEEFDNLISVSRKRKTYIRIISWILYSLLIIYILSYEFLSSSVQKNIELSNRITWLAYKIPTKEINTLNSLRLSMKDEKDYLRLDSLINYYNILPDTTKIK